jgi:hypothetical protein
MPKPGQLASQYTMSFAGVGSISITLLVSFNVSFNLGMAQAHPNTVVT